jgi:hypothetical protein
MSDEYEEDLPPDDFEDFDPNRYIRGRGTPRYDDPSEEYQAGSDQIDRSRGRRVDPRDEPPRRRGERVDRRDVDPYQERGTRRRGGRRRGRDFDDEYGEGAAIGLGALAGNLLDGGRANGNLGLFGSLFAAFGPLQGIVKAGLGCIVLLIFLAGCFGGWIAFSIFGPIAR